MQHTLIPSALTDEFLGAPIAAQAVSGTITVGRIEIAIVNQRVGGHLCGVFADDGITYVSLVNKSQADMRGVFAIDPHSLVSVQLT